MRTKTELDERFEYRDNPAFKREFTITFCAAVAFCGALAYGCLYGLLVFFDWLLHDSGIWR